MKRLDRPFFAQDTLTVARELLGQRLVRVLDDGQRLAGIIVETEAYIGEDDEACHASRGQTARNTVMYDGAGLVYVYLIYGMYHCLNVVTEDQGFPAAVLIRALEPQEGVERMREFRSGQPDERLTSGPGRLCQALAIDRTHNGLDLCSHERLFIEEGRAPARVATSPRIGISADQMAQNRPWRFFSADNAFVSYSRKGRKTTKGK